MPPKVQLALILIAIYLSSLKQYPLLSSLNILVVSVGFTIFFDLLFIFLKKRIFPLPLSALISGLIIGLIINPQAVWYQMAVICALAMAAKNFLRIGEKHIFNPAAVGLFLGGIIFNLPVSWWGASFQNNPFTFLVLLTPSFVSFYKMKRFGSILSFLILYNLLSGFKLLLDPTTIFFALVMLPEPITSPFDLKKQVLYGAIVAVATSILSYFPIFPDVLIPALLLGNLFQFFFK